MPGVDLRALVREGVVVNSAFWTELNIAEYERIYQYRITAADVPVEVKREIAVEAIGRWFEYDSDAEYRAARQWANRAYPDPAAEQERKRAERIIKACHDLGWTRITNALPGVHVGWLLRGESGMPFGDYTPGGDSLISIAIAHQLSKMEGGNQ